MPPKKAPKFKRPRLGRAGRAGRAPADKKNSQKLKQTQRVNVNITSGGGGGGTAAPPFPFYKPEPFVYTKRQNLEDINLFNMIQNAAAKSNMVSGRGNILGRADAEVPNPANDATTTTAVFNAPITYNDTIPEQILREEGNLPSEGKRRRKKKPIVILEEVAAIPEPVSIVEEIKKKRGPQKGVKYGSTKEKYKEVGFQEGIPAGRNIQNEFVMGVEQMQNRKILPGQFTLRPPTPPAMEAPIESGSSSNINFA